MFDFVTAEVREHTSVLLHWAGHALVNPRNELLLAVGGSTPNDVAIDKVRADDLIDHLVALGVCQLFVVIDTCHAASAIVGAVSAALARFEQQTQAKKVAGWVGVLASSQSNGVAIDGAFGKAFLELLRYGPATAADRVHWNAYNAAVRGVDVAHAAHSSWDVSRDQQLRYGHFGWSQPIFPNPLYDPAAGPANLGGHGGGKPPPTKELHADLDNLSGAERSVAMPLLQALMAAQGRGMPARDVWPEVARAARPDEEPFTDADLEQLIAALGRHVVIDTENGQAVFRMANPHARRSLLDAETWDRIDKAVIRLSREESRQGAVNPYLRNHVSAHVRRATMLRRPSGQSADREHRRAARLPESSGVDSALVEAHRLLILAEDLLFGAGNETAEFDVSRRLSLLAEQAGGLAGSVAALLHDRMLLEHEMVARVVDTPVRQQIGR